MYHHLGATVHKYTRLVLQHTQITPDTCAEIFTTVMHLVDRCVVALRLEGRAHPATLSRLMVVAASLHSKTTLDAEYNHLFVPAHESTIELDRFEQKVTRLLDFNIHSTYAALQSWCRANVNTPYERPSPEVMDVIVESATE